MSEILNSLKIFQQKYKKSIYSNTYDISSEIFNGNCRDYFVEIINNLKTIDFPKRAYQIYSFLKENESFKEVKSLEDINAGDIIIWKKDVIPKRGDSGHICFVTRVIGKEMNCLLLKVSDMAKVPHDSDTRSSPQVGEGIIRLLEKHSDAIGFIWGGKIKKTKYTNVKIFRFID